MRLVWRLHDEATAAVGTATASLDLDRELSSVELAQLGVVAAFAMIRGRGVPARLGVVAALAAVALAGCAG